MDRHVKRAPPPLPLPETDYPPVSPRPVSGGDGSADRRTSEVAGVSPTTLRARRFPAAALRRTQTDGSLGSQTSSQGAYFSRSPVTVSPVSTGGGGGFRSFVSHDAIASAAGDGSNQRSVDSVADIFAAADLQRGVTIIYPQREGSEVDAEDDENAHGGPEASVANANEDLAQVRVEGYFDSNAGVLIPNELPKSTLLYVLTASDGRDSMFKCIQYFLQLVICFLHTPSLFSPEMRVFTGMWAGHFYRNYNTIRHGRSLFKVGRGLLNLFTAQAVASRLWLRYGDDVRITFYPVTRRLILLLLRVDSSLRVMGLSALTEKTRIRLTLAASAGANGDGGEDVDVGATDASVSYYYSQARMRAHLKQQQRLRAEANTLLTDDVYSHVSKAEMGARLASAPPGGSPISGNVSEGVTPTTARHVGRTASGIASESTGASHTRPFYVRDIPHGSAGSGVTGSFGVRTGSFSQATSLASRGGGGGGGGSWLPTNAGSDTATAHTAPTGTGLLASTRQTLGAPRLGDDEHERSSNVGLDIPKSTLTAAPTPDGGGPLSGNDELFKETDDGQPFRLSDSVVDAGSQPPMLPQTLPSVPSRVSSHGLQLPGVEQVPSSSRHTESVQAGHGHAPLLVPEDESEDDSANAGGDAASSSHSTGLLASHGGGPCSLSVSATEDGTVDDSRSRTRAWGHATPAMDDFAGYPTLSASDPLFAQVRDKLPKTPQSDDLPARRQTMAPPSGVNDVADDSTNLRHSSDSEGPLSQEATRITGATVEDEGVRFRDLAAPLPAGAASAEPQPAAKGQSAVGGVDPWASAVQAAALVPAAIAAPSHWRKKPTQFNTILMVLLGVRSCSAAIRRFLRDATLVSSERFFNTDLIERHRPRIHRTFNYAWLVVAIIDLLLNTIRLVQPGWTRYATARQNVWCRCGCSGDDPADVVWRTNDFIARRKTDLFFPKLDLDYGAPAASYISYFDAADPVHMMPACSHCGYLYKEVTKTDVEHEPSSSRPPWLKLYEDAANNSAMSVQEDGGAAAAGALAARGGGGASGDQLVSSAAARELAATPVGAGHGGGLTAADTMTMATRGDGSHTVSMLYLPYLMRRVFNYIWLLRCHPNWSSTLLLQLRYCAELFLAWKYCFGKYEPYRTDAPMSSILHPMGAVAGLISASVCLLRVVESAPR